MSDDRIPTAEPSWQPSAIDIGRRQALIGLSGLVVAAMGAERARASALDGEGGWALASPKPQRGEGGRSCVLTPEAGEGPFYLDPKLLRSDITSGKPGAPLQLSLQIVRSGDCATLANARVDVWQADALGLYSGYANQSGVGGVPVQAAVGAQYLRGTQFTDKGGNVEFRTIFPSWYGGRTPHVHFKVFLGGKEVVASQIFFPDEINKEVFSEWQPYRDHVSKRRAFNDNDPIRQGVYSEVARLRGSYAAKALLVVASA